MRYIASLLLLALPMGLFAQSAIYVPYKNKSLWTADTLYVGASFLYTGAASGGGGKWKFGFGIIQPIMVTLKGSEAGWTGELWAIVQSATGAKETVFLFTNHDAPGTSADLRSKVSFPIPAGAEITFMYKVVFGTDYPPSLFPKYSGPNRGFDPYFSQASSDGMPNPNWRFGHRWSVVGRNPAGDLEFGFEDATDDGSDMDFDDVVFTVSNLEIGIFNRKLLARDMVR
ncbi:MAG: hypothetical protein JWP91_2083 [Fibrobacteres bacterium]|nr:hypothetical protein [Fibrobacterota bacterium]